MWETFFTENLTHKTQALEILSSLIKICITQNFKICNPQGYKQDKGLAMSNPLSQLSVDIYKDNFETTY